MNIKSRRMHSLRGRIVLVRSANIYTLVVDIWHWLQSTCFRTVRRSTHFDAAVSLIQALRCCILIQMTSTEINVQKCTN